MERAASIRNSRPLDQPLEEASPHEILRWAWKAFQPDIAVTSSFQTQSVPLLHMVSETVPEMPVLFLDTGFHFQETLAFRDYLVGTLSLNLKVLKPEIGHIGFTKKYGQLYCQNPDLCCYINKVEPMEKARDGLRAWISGIRRDQTLQRSRTPVLSRLPDGTFKICPLVRWTLGDVEAYMHRHQLPEHPLSARGYLSVGCMPCTRPASGDDERAGRWEGTEKTECGLHLNLDSEAGSE